MILAILQARMSSTRLPGKVLKPLLGKPMLLRQIERVKRSRMIDRLVVATSVGADDDVLAQLCAEHDIECLRGSLDDVLDRFYQAASAINPTHVMRLTGDCPLADPGLLDALARLHLDAGNDYSSLSLELTFPNGLEAELMTMSALETAWRESTLPSQREHVTPFLYQNPDRFKLQALKNDVDLSHMRWTVDEPADFEFVTRVYEGLYPDTPRFDWHAVLDYLEKNPELEAINCAFKRNEGYAKSLRKDAEALKSQAAPCVFIRADASLTMGSGHVMRCLTLADALRAEGARVEFICRTHTGHLCDTIEARGFNVHRLPALEVPVDGWLGVSLHEETLQSQAILSAQDQVDWLVVDHYGLDRAWQEAMRPSVKRVLVIDDLANRPHDCDVLLDQNLCAGMETRYDGLVPKDCQTLLGPRYVLLRPEFKQAKASLTSRPRQPRVTRLLVFFGGADATNETTKALDALEQVGAPDLNVDVVVGASNPHREAIRSRLAGLSGYSLHVAVNNMAALMARSDLCLGAGGTTTWERCYLGLATLILSLAENQKPSIEAVARAQAAWNLGRADDVSVESLATRIKQLLDNPEEVAAVSKRAFALMASNDEGPTVAALMMESCRVAT